MVSEFAIARALYNAARDVNREEYFNEQVMRYRLIVREVTGRTRDGAVLDLGLGQGHVATALARLGYHAFGLDYYPGENYNDRTAQADDFTSALAVQGVEVRHCDLQTDPFPFDDDSMDIVILAEVLEHLWASIDHPLRQIARVLKPGGHVIITTPNAASLLNRLNLLLGKSVDTSLDSMYYLPSYMRHCREYTLAEVCEVASRAGLTPVQAECYSYNFYRTRLPDRDGRHVFSDRFLLNSGKQVRKLLAQPLLSAIPSLRDNLMVTARKPS